MSEISKASEYLRQEHLNLRRKHHRHMHRHHRGLRFAKEEDNSTTVVDAAAEATNAASDMLKGAPPSTDESVDPCEEQTIGKFMKLACNLVKFFRGQGQGDDITKTAEALKAEMVAASKDPTVDGNAALESSLKKIATFTSKKLDALTEEGSMHLSETESHLTEVASLVNKTQDSTMGPADLVPFLVKARKMLGVDSFGEKLSRADKSSKTVVKMRAELAAVQKAIEWLSKVGDSTSPKTLPQILADINTTKTTYMEAKVHLKVAMTKAKNSSDALAKIVESLSAGTENIEGIKTEAISAAAETADAAQKLQTYTAMLREHLRKQCGLAKTLGTRKNPDFAHPFCDSLATNDLSGYVPDDGSSDPEIVKAHDAAMAAATKSFAIAAPVQLGGGNGSSVASNASDMETDRERSDKAALPFPAEELKAFEPPGLHDADGGAVNASGLHDADGGAVNSSTTTNTSDMAIEIEKLRNEVASMKQMLNSSHSGDDDEEEAEEEDALSKAATGGANDDEEEKEESEENENSTKVSTAAPSTTAKAVKPTTTAAPKSDDSEKTWEHPTIVARGELNDDSSCGCPKKEKSDCDCSGEASSDDRNDGGAPSKPLFLDPNPCPACGDGVQNCGEVGIDCGGPCAKCAPPPVKDVPKGSSVIDALWVGQSIDDRVKQLAEMGKKYRSSDSRTSLHYERSDPGDAKAEITVNIPSA